MPGVDTIGGIICVASPDLEEEDTEEDKQCKVYSSWDQTPDILLEEIFSYLTIRERYYASLVCRSWYRAFKLQNFMNMISWYAEQQGLDNTSVAGVGTYIRRLKFTFPCNMANRNDPDRIRLFGTGGKLLEALKRLMRNLQNLRYLELIDLMLDSKEAVYLMDDICTNCTQTLSKLVLINTTRYNCPLLHVGVFVNLNILVISPQNLHEDIIELIGYTKLRHLHILQNRYSPKDTTIRLPKRSSWVKMKMNNPYLKVHFEIESHKSTDILLPIDLLEHSAIPCHSIVLDNPNTQISPPTILTHGTFFDSTIRVYAFKGLTRYYLHRNFAKRLDESLVQFCRMCPNLHTLMIRDKISTATILEIVSTAKRLCCLYVRRNVILKRCDRVWSTILDWSPEYYEWIKINSRSYEKTEKEVSRILGYRWHMLSEKEFKEQVINMHI
ncbi:hypothetical protein X777_00329 [Ooceraea biroi]|uniref:F-box domain-containing protein n=1 Tax=Ooceraea biroi TaxID=2015173 RepID=A0A026WUZ6_OOCBI|nr:hypothetical protein X777_00329 [Ooceraea biroi]